MAGNSSGRAPPRHLSSRLPKHFRKSSWDPRFPGGTDPAVVVADEETPSLREAAPASWHAG